MKKRMVALFLSAALLFSTMTALADESTVPSVYYNSNGGSRFHADRECASISQNYWPSMQSASPAELRSVLASLSPCSYCVTNEVLNTWCGGSAFWSAWHITREYLLAQETQPLVPLSWMTSQDMNEMLICVQFRDNRLAQCHLINTDEIWQVVDVCWIPSLA